MSFSITELKETILRAKDHHKYIGEADRIILQLIERVEKLSEALIKGSENGVFWREEAISKYGVDVELK